MTVLYDILYICGGVQAGCTALQRAAAEGHEDLVKQLLKHKAAVNMQDNGVSSTRTVPTLYLVVLARKRKERKQRANCRR